MQKAIKERSIKYGILFLIFIYILINKNKNVFEHILLSLGNFYYLLLFFFIAKFIWNFFQDEGKLKEVVNIRLNFFLLFYILLANLIILFNLQGNTLETFIDSSLYTYNNGFIFTAIFSRIYKIFGKLILYIIYIPSFILVFLIVFGKIIGFIVRKLIAFKRSDFLKNYKANWKENQIKRKEKARINKINKQAQKKKKKLEKLSNIIATEEIKPRYHEKENVK